MGAADRFKLAQHLRGLLPGWEVFQHEAGGKGKLMVYAPDGWSSPVRKVSGQEAGWHEAEARQVAAELRASRQSATTDLPPARNYMEALIDLACQT